MSWSSSSGAFLATDEIDVDVDGVLVGLASVHEALTDGSWWPRVQPQSAVT
jgi:hypothetical protein